MCTNFDGSVGRCNRCRTSAVRRLLRVASRVSRSLFSPLTSRGLLLRCSAAFLLQVQLRETIRDVKTLHNQNLVAVAQKKYVYIYDNQGAEVHTSMQQAQEKKNVQIVTPSNERAYVCMLRSVDDPARACASSSSRPPSRLRNLLRVLFDSWFA